MQTLWGAREGFFIPRTLFSRPGVGFRSSRPRRAREGTPFGSQQERRAVPQEPISGSRQQGSKPPRLSPPQAEPHSCLAGQRTAVVTRSR